FHAGQTMTADDVVFSLGRAQQPTSGVKGLLTAIDSVSKVDDLTIRIKTKGPNPLLPSYLTNIFVMSKAWAEANNSVTVQDFKEKKDNFAVRNANGTGPYTLVSREQDVRTVMKRFDGYWGKGMFPLGVTEINYVTIKSDATRIASLLSGEVDFVQDVPVQDIDRLAKTANLRVNFGPENRSIFLGFNVGSGDLASSDIKGKNPFADVRVRRAVSMAIDREAIKAKVMRGQSVPSGMIAPPFVNGYTKELDKVPAVDVDGAKKLLAEAGYAAGFSVALNCPNDRYVSDEAICQAVVAMLARIGIKVTLVSQSKTKHFPLIEKNPPETDFFLLGWGVPTYDSHYIFSFLYHSRSGKEGSFNGTRYANPDMDKLIAGLTSETDQAKRNATIAEIWKKVHADTVYAALHNQTLAFAMSKDWDLPTSPENAVRIKFFGPVAK
ncbi:MAG TPA: ABC transporter substrate-binding protein, partial [Hyphomicrobiaceae bacterium]|nr:ABC transporter substrate-binding protein [Hyphomicrobiaceae bacterium]